MTLKKKILVISWFYPPVISSEGMVTYKLLNNSLLEYDVFTQKTNVDWSYGCENLSNKSNINVIQADVQKIENFEKAALDYYDKNMDKYDIVMTRSMPEESHKIGIKIKNKNPKIKWIASFGDPIGKNPYVIRMLKTSNPYAISGLKSVVSVKRFVKSYLFKRAKRYHYKNLVKNKCDLENLVVETADKIILNNTYQQEYMARNSKDYNMFMKKSIVIEHSYDEALYESDTHENGKKIFRFIGHLDDIRTPRQLLRAIKNLKDYDNELEKKVQFEFYGDISDSDKLYVMNNELLELVKIKKSVGYLESLRLMQTADWLIHIDANISDVLENNIFFAAKLADYIGTKNNIMGITMPTGASADILREHNKLCVSNCEDEIENYLFLIIYKNYKLKEDKKVEELNAKNIAGKFENIIKTI